MNGKMFDSSNKPEKCCRDKAKEEMAQDEGIKGTLRGFGP